MIKRALIFLDRFYWLWLALATPFMLFPSPKRSLAMLVVPGLYLLRFLAIKVNLRTVHPKIQKTNNEQPFVIPNTPFNAALLLMIFMVLVSLWASFDINFSLPKISGVVLGLGIFLAFARAGQTPRGWWTGFLLFLGAGLSIAVIGLLGTKWATKIAFLTPIISRLVPRIIGLPGAEEGFHPNTVAGALLWVIPSFLALCCLLLTRSKDVYNFIGRGKAIATSVLIIIAALWTMATLILTQSRDGYISLSLTLPVLFMIALPRRWRWYGLALTILLAVFLGMFIASQWGTVHTWIVGDSLKPSMGLSLETINGRMEVWSRALYGIQDFPLTGMGMNTFRKVITVLYPLQNITPDMDIGHAHNEFLQAALDLGIPGLIAFIALYIIAFWMLVRTWHAAGDFIQPNSNELCAYISVVETGGWFSNKAAALLSNACLVRIAVLGLGGGLLAHMLWGMIDAMALGARPAFLYWIILGLISGMYKQVQEYLAVRKNNISKAETKSGFRK